MRWGNSVITALLVFPALWSHSNSASAQKVHMMGLGTEACSSWTVFRKRSYGDLLRFGTEAWVLGYLSAYASASGRDIKAQADGILIAIDKYCELKPLQNIGGAANSVAQDLQRSNDSQKETGQTPVPPSGSRSHIDLTTPHGARS
jgi:hypothetical protein